MSSKLPTNFRKVSRCENRLSALLGISFCCWKPKYLTSLRTATSCQAKEGHGRGQGVAQGYGTQQHKGRSLPGRSPSQARALLLAFRTPDSPGHPRRARRTLQRCARPRVPGCRPSVSVPSSVTSPSPDLAPALRLRYPPAHPVPPFGCPADGSARRGPISGTSRLCLSPLAGGRSVPPSSPAQKGWGWSCPPQRLCFQPSRSPTVSRAP